MTAPTSAKQLVYRVLHKLLPATKFTDDTNLADVGYGDPVTNDIIRAAINTECGSVLLPRGALDGCKKVKDVTAVVSGAMPKKK